MNITFTTGIDTSRMGGGYEEISYPIEQRVWLVRWLREVFQHNENPNTNEFAANLIDYSRRPLLIFNQHPVWVWWTDEGEGNSDIMVSEDDIEAFKMVYPFFDDDEAKFKEVSDTTMAMNDDELLATRKAITESPFNSKRSIAVASLITARIKQLEKQSKAIAQREEQLEEWER